MKYLLWTGFLLYTGVVVELSTEIVLLHNGSTAEDAQRIGIAVAIAAGVAVALITVVIRLRSRSGVPK